MSGGEWARRIHFLYRSLYLYLWFDTLDTAFFSPGGGGLGGRVGGGGSVTVVK